MLNDPRTHGLWERTAPEPPVTGALTGERRSDVVIVGGGYTGLSGALHLAEAGVSVTLLEAHEFGFGGAGRNVGLINAGMWVMPEDLLATLGPVYGERLLTGLGEGPRTVMALIERHGIACELVKNGTLHCAVGHGGRDEVEARYVQWVKRGAPVELLSAAETAARIGTEAYAGSLLDMRAGTLQPLAYARGLALAASRAGALLHIGSAVTSAVRDGGRWRVATADGAVEADWMIVATDAYGAGPFVSVREEQVHLPYFNFATTPLTPEQRAEILPGLEGCWDTRTVLSSFRLDAAGRLVFGSVGELKGLGAAIHEGWAHRALGRLFPALRGIAFEHAWYGQIGMNGTALPRLHRYGDNAIGFSAYNGRGISPGTVFGKVLADFVRGAIGEADLPLPVTALEPPRWRRAEELYYARGAELAHLVGARL
jgi:glycine/D-amino acid oxidase-like deaminating enzyme